MCCIKFEDSSCLEATNKINKNSLIKKTEHYYEVIHVENLATIKITINTITSPLLGDKQYKHQRRVLFPMTWQILKIKN